MAQNRRHQAPTPWYATSNAKIGIGVAGILILVGILFGMNQLANAGGASNTPPPNTGLPPVENGVQVIRMAVTQNGYEPDTLTVKAGIPVKWIVDGSGVTGCTRNLVSPTFGINQRLTAGENVIKFTPSQTGAFPFHCSMNMVRGTMNVV